MKTERSGPSPLAAPAEGARRYRLADVFTLVEHGKLKSTLLLYSFSMAFLILALYAAAFLLLLRPLDGLVSGRMSAPMASWIEGLVPSLLGTGLCVLLQTRIREKRMMPLGFVWLWLMVLPTLAVLLWMLAPEDRAVYLASIAAPMALLPLAIGTASSFFLYIRHMRSAVPGRDAEGTLHEPQR